eukprot:1192860-Prorocentrum_minimum.AAC.2
MSSLQATDGEDGDSVRAGAGGEYDPESDAALVEAAEARGAGEAIRGHWGAAAAQLEPEGGTQEAAGRGEAQIQ